MFYQKEIKIALKADKTSDFGVTPQTKKKQQQTT